MFFLRDGDWWYESWKLLDQPEKWKIQVNISDFPLCVISKKSGTMVRKSGKSAKSKFAKVSSSGCWPPGVRLGKLHQIYIHGHILPPPANLRKKLKWKTFCRKLTLLGQWCFQNWQNKKHSYACVGPAYIHSHKLSYIFFQQFKLGEVKVSEKSHNEIFKRSVAAPLQFPVN